MEQTRDGSQCSTLRTAYFALVHLLLRVEHVHATKDIRVGLLKAVPPSEVDLKIGRVACRIAVDSGAAIVCVTRAAIRFRCLEPHADELQVGGDKHLSKLEQREGALAWMEQQVAAASRREELGTAYHVAAGGQLFILWPHDSGQ